MQLLDIYKQIFCNKPIINEEHISNVTYWNNEFFNKCYLSKYNIAEEEVAYYMDLYKPVHKFLNVYEILNEYVEDPGLTPVPKQLLDNILEKIKISKENIYSISYNEIYKLLNSYDYEYVDEFKQNLINKQMYNGKLYKINCKIDYSL